MKISKFKDVKFLCPRVFEDERGFFFESYNEKEFEKLIGRNVHFVQDNHSKSSEGVLRGLHFQVRRPQGKLIRVLQGEIFDVFVDIRAGSKTFGEWDSIELSSENKVQAWVPPGFAHGFYVTSEYAEIQYKTTDYWFPKYEQTLVWNDRAISIDWPFEKVPLLAEKDKHGLTLSDLGMS